MSHNIMWVVNEIVLFQGVLEDIETLQANVTSVNATCTSLLEHANPEFKAKLQDQVDTLNKRYLIRP